MTNTLPVSVTKNKKLNFKLTAVFETMFSFTTSFYCKTKSYLKTFHILMQFSSIVENIMK